jgi:preprotein translocase subunit SecA
LSPGVPGKGGLRVIGTERHEARRIDNQLRGRSGRQGDPGSSRFYISLEDDLMRIFGSDRISGLMQRLGMEEGEEIQHPLVSRAIETAQRRVETRNFEIRKHLLEYDDVMNRQREIIYSERDRVLKGENLREHIFEMIEDVVEGFLIRYVNPDLREDEKKPDELAEALSQKFGVSFNGIVEETGTQIELLLEKIVERLKVHYGSREQAFGPERTLFLERYILLQVADSKWKDHLYALDNLKEGIHLRAYGQRDPLVEYKREAFELFDEMVETIKQEAIELLFKVAVVREETLTSTFQRTPHEFVHPEAGGMVPEKNVGAPLMAPAAPQPPQPIHRDEPKVGRNDPCPCGSGKKYKKCHGA